MRWAVCISLCGFYAEVARRRRDLPATVPVVVMRGDAALDGDRSAYALGLRPGSPLRQVRRACPGATVIEYEEKEYLAAAEAFWTACLDHTPQVEPGAGGVDRPALHRVCLGLPTPSEQPPRAEVAALVQALVPAFGFAAPAGLGANKLVAAAAAHLQRDALLGLAGPRRGALQPGAGSAFPAVVAPGQEAAFLAHLGLPYLWPATAEEQRRLAELGLARIGEVAAVPAAELVRQFGPRGQLLHRWSRGSDPDPVRAAWPPRTVAARLTFPAPRTDALVLEAAVARLAGQLAMALQGRDEACQQAELALELADGGRRSAERTFSRPQNSPYYVEQTLLVLLRQLLSPAAGASPPEVAALEAALGNLGPVPRQQASLLAELPAGGSDRASAWPAPGPAGGPPVAPAPVGQPAMKAVALRAAVPAGAAAPTGAAPARPAPARPAPDPERLARLDLTIAALRERYPAQLVRVGMPAVPSRREAMLRLYDPYRWASGEEGAGAWHGSSASR